MLTRVRPVDIVVGAAVVSQLLSGAWSKCYDPSPAFPPPLLSLNDSVLVAAFDSISAQLSALANQPGFNGSSFSIGITSSTETLWEYHHTAVVKNKTRPGVEKVDSNSAYRIASITKAFTTLAILQQHVAGNLSLDNTIDQYIPELKEPQEGTLPWKDITLRTLASQLSGLPREFAQSDVINRLDDPTQWGLPPTATDDLLSCDEYSPHYEVPCTKTDLINTVRKAAPLFAPKQKSTYSNVNFDLLGLVIENVAGVNYTDHVHSAIFEPLGMDNSTFSTPDDSVAVLPIGNNYWDVNEGVQNPTGGIYTTSSDLSRFVRYVLNHYNGITPQVNWFQPTSYSTTLSSFYGMPWEIFRTTKILNQTSRPVTFTTKGGGLPGYTSWIIFVSEYDLGITILVGGFDSKLPGMIRQIVTTELVRGAEIVAQAGLDAKYTGTYSAHGINSSITFHHTGSKGLYVDQFISNGTNIIDIAKGILGEYAGEDDVRLQLVPTLLYRDQKAEKGELWRIIAVPEQRNPDDIWDEACNTDDDPQSYAGKPLWEVVFWDNEEGEVTSVELTAFRVRMERAKKESAPGSALQENFQGHQHQQTFLSG